MTNVSKSMAGCARFLLEKQLRDEQDETARDHRLDFWLSLVSSVA